MATHNAGGAETLNSDFRPYDPLFFILCSIWLDRVEGERGGEDSYRRYFMAKYRVDTAEAERVKVRSTSDKGVDDERVLVFNKTMRHTVQRRYASFSGWNSEEQELQFDEYQLELYYALIHGVDLNDVWVSIQLDSLAGSGCSAWVSTMSRNIRKGSCL